MPSTVSRVVSRPFASSTVITPSLPTFSIASAMSLPISESLFAEIVPTWAISLRPAVGTEIFFSSSTTVSTALSMPRFSAIGFDPAVTDFNPSRKIACASTVAVVVPSPARSEVLVATSFTIWAPMSTLPDRRPSVLPVKPPALVLGLQGPALVLPPRAGSDRHDLPLDRLFLRRIRDVEAAFHRFRLLQRPDHHAIRQREDLELGLARRCRCHDAQPPTGRSANSLRNNTVSTQS